MPYLNVDLDYFDHRKTLRLEAILGPGAAELPLRLWAYCGKFHQETGELLGYSDTEIEQIAKWSGDSGKMITTLLRPEIMLLEKIDGGYAIHDWLEHAGHLAAFKKRAKTANYHRWKRIANPNKRNRSARLAHARKLGKHTKAQWECLKELCDFICVRCQGTELPVEKDHIKPVYQGGSDSIRNIQPVCAKCNASKTGESIDYRVTHLIRLGKAKTNEEAECLLEGLLDASLTSPTTSLVGKVGKVKQSIDEKGGEEEKYETPESAKRKRDQELNGIRRECEHSAGSQAHSELLTRTRETIKRSRQTVEASRVARLARLEALHVTTDQWRGFEEMREKIHKPMTERAEDMAVHKLEQLAAEGQNAGDCLDQSTFHNWQGIYSLKVINGGRRDEKTGQDPNERIQRILKRGL